MHRFAKQARCSCNCPKLRFFMIGGLQDLVPPFRARIFQMPMIEECTVPESALLLLNDPHKPNPLSPGFSNGLLGAQLIDLEEGEVRIDHTNDFRDVLYKIKWQLCNSTLLNRRSIISKIVFVYTADRRDFPARPRMSLHGNSKLVSHLSCMYSQPECITHTTPVAPKCNAGNLKQYCTLKFLHRDWRKEKKSEILSKYTI